MCSNVDLSCSLIAVVWGQGRNFALNPTEGLKIHAFKDAHTARAAADRELDKLARYMVHIATVHEDFRDANHKVSIACSIGAIMF